MLFLSYHPAVSIPKSNTTLKVSVDSSNKILYASFSHNFSDLHKKDLFRVSVLGKNLVNGQVVFDIINFKHQQIFSATFPALDLLGDEEDVLPTEKQKETKIKLRIKNFFAARNFLVPAIKPNQKFDADNYDQDLWNEIKADPSIIGFNYQHGYEGNYRIAYSKKKKKVVQYFYSD